MKNSLIVLVSLVLLFVCCNKEQKHYILAIRTTFVQDIDGASIDIYAVDDSSAYRQAYKEFLEFVDKSYNADSTINPYDFEIHLCGPNATNVFGSELQVKDPHWKEAMQEKYCSEKLKQKMQQLKEEKDVPGTGYIGYWK